MFNSIIVNCSNNFFVCQLLFMYLINVVIAGQLNLLQKKEHCEFCFGVFLNNKKVPLRIALRQQIYKQYC